jgi:hypothetical protein
MRASKYHKKRLFRLRHTFPLSLRHCLLAFWSSRWRNRAARAAVQFGDRFILIEPPPQSTVHSSRNMNFHHPRPRRETNMRPVARLALRSLRGPR